MKIKATFLISLLLATFSLASCSSESQTIAEDNNITTIKTVLQEQFTGPDLEMINLLEKPENASIIKEEETSPPENPTALDKLLEKKYKTYFTDTMYDKFIGAYAMDFQTSAYYGNYQISVKNIDVKQSESAESSYDFRVNVLYQKEGNKEEKAEISGKAIVNEESRIAKIDYLDDGDLTNIFNE
ncbi:hypothetical protein [Gracilibacillus salinarum]|uniref:Lipoprotein n=1 Tax=Gracilibacillus salinarum TaxID=2932255 RepID=A0ABY4GI38_9BACI|nr:hypothetical protein [Gracilibacillus salinarum]UOQ83432.1 hypothetical protein MUN87_11730 [Gracilibacillus salinarum]